MLPLVGRGFKQTLPFVFPTRHHRLYLHLTRSLIATVTPPKRVGTHNGSFHCDEALGCFMFASPTSSPMPKSSALETPRDRYDHRQKGFEEVFGHGFKTKLSSAGLVYKHFGKEIIAKELQVREGHLDVHRLFLAVYKSFMEAIDAVDNGINQYDTDQPPRNVNNAHLSSLVSRLNLDWIDPDQSSDKENKAFQRAMELAGSESLSSVRYHAKSWLPARSIVMECLLARWSVDPRGEIMVLTRSCPISMQWMIGANTGKLKRRQLVLVDLRAGRLLHHSGEGLGTRSSRRRLGFPDAFLST